MPRAAAAHADDDSDLQITQRRVSAAGLKPAVLATARACLGVVPPIVEQAPAEIPIRKGVPLPTAVNRRASGAYLAVVKQMEVGDSVELPTKQGLSFYRICTRYAAANTPRPKFTRRVVTAQSVGIWRTA